MGFWKNFFGELSDTPATPLEEKAANADWQVEALPLGRYLVHGYDANGNPDTWDCADEKEAHGLLDHANSVQMGEEYGVQTYGENWWERDETGEIKQDVRDYRTSTYYNEEYKPGWRRLLGL